MSGEILSSMTQTWLQQSLQLAYITVKHLKLKKTHRYAVRLIVKCVSLPTTQTCYFKLHYFDLCSLPSKKKRLFKLHTVNSIWVYMHACNRTSCVLENVLKGLHLAIKFKDE